VIAPQTLRRFDPRFRRAGRSHVAAGSTVRIGAPYANSGRISIELNNRSRWERPAVPKWTELDGRRDRDFTHDLIPYLITRHHAAGSEVKIRILGVAPTTRSVVTEVAQLRRRLGP